MTKKCEHDNTIYQKGYTDALKDATKKLNEAASSCDDGFYAGAFEAAAMAIKCMSVPKLTNE